MRRCLTFRRTFARPSERWAYQHLLRSRHTLRPKSFPRARDIARGAAAAGLSSPLSYTEYMHIQALDIPVVLLIVPRRFADGRGYFVETWNRKAFANSTLEVDFVQDNESFNRHAGTVRGLHFQKPPSAQAKLVRVVTGRAFDVAVDLRAGSPTFGRWVAAELTAERGEQIFIPPGFAHGFCTLEDNTIVTYKVDAHYDPAAEAGIAWDDPRLAIAWPPVATPQHLSERDRVLPSFVGSISPFSFT